MTDKTTSKTLRVYLDNINSLTERDLALSSWSNGRRRVYRVVEKVENGGERDVSPSGYSSEIGYWLKGYQSGLAEARK